MEPIQKVTDIFSILADPTRLSILKVLLEEKEYCVSDIAQRVSEVSFSAVSHQLARLEARGVVYCYRKGQKACYRLNNNVVAKKIKKILQVV